MKTLGFPLEVKELTDDGTFEGLGSVYGNVDQGADIVVAGAFKEFKLTKDNHIRILDGHNTRAPIGKGTLTDTHVGLAVKGKLNLKVSRSRDVYELMKDGVIDGLSIGFDVLPNGEEIKDGIRYLKALRLWEISVTPFPMNELAQVNRVKQLQQITTIREFEDFLRDAGGFSKEQAKILCRSYKALPGQRDADGEAGDSAKELLDFLDSIGKKAA